MQPAAIGPVETASVDGDRGHRISHPAEPPKKPAGPTKTPKVRLRPDRVKGAFRVPGILAGNMGVCRTSA